ncbi:hypothetical protein BT69DRAFT_1276764 [Atractiella rhizophila]|nr:hypothetical protein BT69DRAFT_1276764 [Atractiella rhizophila]
MSSLSSKGALPTFFSNAEPCLSAVAVTGRVRGLIHGFESRMESDTFVNRLRLLGMLLSAPPL